MRCTTLTKTAGGVLRRQDRELRAGAGAQRAHRALEDVVGKRIDVDVDGLADRDIGEVGFLQIGIDPGLGIVDHTEDRAAGVEA